MTKSSGITFLFFFFLILFGFPARTTSETILDPLISAGEKRTLENQNAQQKINQVHNTTLNLIKDYETNLKIVDGLQTYNAMMQRQVEKQLDSINALRESILNVSVIERQILPLLNRMLDGLYAFIKLDTPFLLEERYRRIDLLREVLDRVDVSAAEKTRRVFEAYQIEVEYGRTIESYREKIVLEHGVFDADVLRIGRIALIYRIIGVGDLGFWDQSHHQWQSLSGSHYRTFFEKGIKIANEEIAPEMLQIPILVEGGYQ